MSYRRPANRHDAWIYYRNRHAGVFREIGVADVVETERSFRAFLTTGRGGAVCADIEALSPEQFAKLFHLVTSRFDMDAGDFTAFEARRLRGDVG